MVFHRQSLPHQAKPDRPDAVSARRLDEVRGGQYSEIAVAMRYGFQCWNAQLPGTHRDPLYGVGAEEFGHAEILARTSGSPGVFTDAPEPPTWLGTTAQPHLRKKAAAKLKDTRESK